MKKQLLTLIFFGSVILSNAQTKYEYMTIVFSTYRYTIGVTIDGKQFLDEDLDIPKSDKNDRNTSPLLQKVTLYEDQGWELINMECVSTNIQGFGTKEYIPYLMKKRPGQR